MNEIYSEILHLRLDHTFLSILKEFISKVDHLISWEEFGRIPFSTSHSSPRIFLRDLYHACARKTYMYLSYSSTHSYLLQRLSKRACPKSRLLFSFLCLNQQIDKSELVGVIDPGDVTHYVEAGLFLRRDSKLMLPVTLVPYRNYYYLSEALHVGANRGLYNIQPAHIGVYTHLQVVYLKQRLKHRPIKSMLEMGCGIGVVSLEMSDTVPYIEGVELYDRNLEFARANQALRNNTSIRFHQSNLFYNVKSKYDLIVFAPWIPSEDSLELTKQFLQEAPSYLNENGRIMLLLSSQCVNGNDMVFDEVIKILRKQSLQASQDIICSYYLEEKTGKRALRADYYLWIERQAKSKGSTNVPIRRNISFKGIGFWGRRILN
jgi:protein-L-isoaspartate O-methyltransferase